jgi:microcin C transport system permease protein
MNWLGTDDQGRDVTARLIYGFRISVLFGLTLTIFSALDRHRRGCGAGLFRRLDRPVDASASSRSGRRCRCSTSADHRRRSAAGVLDPARDHAAVFLGVALSAWCGRNSCAPQFRICQRGRARWAWATRTIMFRHLLPNAMVATLTFLPFILSGSITTLTSLDFPRLRPAAGLASLGELMAQGKATCRRHGWG